MYYRLTDHIALRSWPDIGFAFYRKGGRSAVRLAEKQAKTLLLCDGEHDIATDAMVMYLVMKKLIEPCEQGNRPSDWSAYKKYDNRYVPMMNLMVTGKCNFNCLHCFNAADNAGLMTEWSFEDICGLLDDARDCGIAGFTITGGEPMMHGRFLDIVREIYKRHMTVFALNTNGWYITREMLEELKALGCSPEIKISFDGIGVHDWMRRRKGAQKNAIDAMKLCLQNGFEVVSNTQVNRKNLHTMMPTAKLLDSIGVQQMRIIRTTEVPRWEENAPNACLSLEEYYDSMLNFAVEYIHSGLNMGVQVWQYLGLIPQDRSYYLKPVKFTDTKKPGDSYCCECAHSMVAVTSAGEIMPCNQMSGYLLKNGISFGNLHQTPLKELLRGGEYVRIANLTAKDLQNGGGKCKNCPYLRFCGGGCRALGVLYTGEQESFMREDITKCYFFENGWYQKITQALSEWSNLSEISMP